MAKARANLIEYTCRMMPSYQPARHHGIIAAHLEAVERGELQRLMVQMPPRGGKSELCSVRFPAWFIGRNPDRRVIGASYGAQLAHRFGGKVRDQFYDPRWPFEAVDIKDDSRARHQWDIAGHGGGMLAAGRGGPITGQGGPLLNLDDMVKDREEADSDTIQDSTWDWYRDTLYTRLEPSPEGWPGAIVYTGTRWSELDLGGRLENAMKDGSGDAWTILRIPAICEDEERDPLGRKQGESYWPERFPVPVLERIRRTLGERGWYALYQQRPMPAEGGILKSKWWKYWTYNGEVEGTHKLPEMDVLIQSWDMTFKDGKHNDYVVGQVWGQHGANAFLLDQWCQQADFVTTKMAVVDMSRRWPKARLKLIEDTANGPAIISELANIVPGMVAVTPQGSKFARAASVAPYVEAGNIYLPHPSIAPYTEGFVAECAAFPNGAHDDKVDAMSQALRRLADGLDEITDQRVDYYDPVRISRW